MDNSSKKIAVMQPYVFPYLGYFQLINAVDEFVFYDDVNFIKRGWINRNRILYGNDFKLITFPCQKISQNKYIKDIKIDLKAKEYLKLRETINYTYKNAPFYSEVLGIINDVFDSHINNISELAIKSVKKTSEYIGLKKMFSVSSNSFSEYQNYLKEERLIKICKKSKSKIYINPIGGRDLYTKQDFKKEGINLYFLKPSLPEYKQFNHPFVSGLSIIDIMMFNSPEEIRSMLNQYALI